MPRERGAQGRVLNDADFSGATFTGIADFKGVTFSGQTLFSKATFCGNACFKEVTFSADARFDKAQFCGDADFAGATFRRRVRFNPAAGGPETLIFDDAAFEEDVQLDVAVGAIRLWRTRFAGRADLNVLSGDVTLGGATFLQRSRLAGVARSQGVDDRKDRNDQCVGAQQRPRLLSLRQANVENLALGHIDLRACRFFGAHGLDQLRIEADCDFAEPPQGWRYTHRRTLAEEHHWRNHLVGCPAEPKEDVGEATRDWYPPECRPPDWLHATPILTPAQIAPIYRSLRKAFEDRKDEPGAGDFYYGEMEMRRLTPPADRRPEGRVTRDRGERTILWLYWLVSGYGTRATRAFVALLVTLIVGTALIWLIGLNGDREVSDALLQSIEGAAFRAGDRTLLNECGQYVQVGLRILGPVFLGLALLSLRGRVKR